MRLLDVQFSSGELATVCFSHCNGQLSSVKVSLARPTNALSFQFRKSRSICNDQGVHTRLTRSDLPATLAQSLSWCRLVLSRVVTFLGRTSMDRRRRPWN